MSHTVTQDHLRRLEGMMDLDTEKLHLNYVGRGGHRGLGYSGEEKLLFLSNIAYLISESEEGEEPSALDLIEMIGELGEGARDGMGLDTIAYWPGLVYEDPDARDYDTLY